MAEQRPDTGRPPRLRSVSPDTETDTQGDASAAHVSVSVSPASVAPLSVAGHAGVGIRAMAGVARDLWLAPDRFLHVIIHGRAETMAQHRAHIKSRNWVPPEMTGAAEKAVIGAGLFHHLVIARPLKASMKAVKFAAEKVDQAADRPLRLYLTVILIVALIVLLARYL